MVWIEEEDDLLELTEEMDLQIDQALHPESLWGGISEWIIYELDRHKEGHADTGWAQLLNDEVRNPGLGVKGRVQSLIDRIP